MKERQLWIRAQAVFERVIEAPTGEQAQILEEECGSDEDLSQAVRGLLQADRTGSPLPTARAADEALELLEEDFDRRWIGRQLGAYRLLEKLGVGGMGVVFLARRDDTEFDKLVAIKLLAFGLGSPEDRRRFRAERQILAGLEHPGIGRLIDGGTTDEGAPYLVMERIEGAPITVHCDEARLPLRKRLELFRRVCDAVQYAHQNLVVHRDLKAGNILVTAGGQPKLLDFGIAKLLPEVSAEGTDATVTQGRKLTPDYASPEQVRGGLVTTATDVYSLGVLLFEILVGRRPFRFSGCNRLQAEKRLLEEEPPAPSVALAALEGEAAADVAASRETAPRRLQRRLAGDLDNIVLKALRKESERRYPSVEQLSQDIGRFLRGLPVEARPATLGYRLVKFLRRNAVAVAGGAAFLAMAAVFTTVTWVQGRRVVAERDIAFKERERAEAVTDFLVNTFVQADPGRARGGQMTAREILDNGARQIDREIEEQPVLRATLLHTLGTVFSGLGLYQEAEGLLKEAWDLRREVLAPEDPARVDTLFELGLVALRRGQAEPAERFVTQAFEEVAAESPQQGRLHRLLGSVRELEGRRDEAIRLQEEALEWDRQLGNDDPQVVDGLISLGSALTSRGLFDRAESVYAEALALQRQHRPGDQTATVTVLRNQAALARRRGDFESARILAQGAAEMARRIYGERHPVVAEVMNTLGILEARSGNPDQARRNFEKSLDLFRDLLGSDHPRLAGPMINLGNLLHRDLGRTEDAEPLLAQAVDLFRKAVEEQNPQHPNLAFLLSAHGRILNALGRPADAEERLREALAIWVQRDQGTQRNGSRVKIYLAESLVQTGRHREARQLLLESRAFFFKDPDKGAADLNRIQRALAAVTGSG